MKKTGVFIFLLLVFSLVPLAFAAEGDACDSLSDCDSGETCQNSECTSSSTSSSTTTAQQDPNKIVAGYDCLEEKAADCSGLTTQEIAYTILATPDNIFDECVKVLEDRKSSDNWGNVRDTALAILALDHAGKDTEASELWLLSQVRTPTELIWYLEQDSNEAVTCNIGYQTNDYSISIGENKKIDVNAGSCLTRAQSNFWLEVNPSCYDEEFNIECDKNFIATLLYKNKNSPTIYPIEGTESSPAFGSIKLKVNSKCFGTTSCEYEATAWATQALLEKGYNVDEFIPYIIAMAESNKQYLPYAFIYMSTNYEDYASQLIADQRLGNYWEAPSSAYNKFYDTSLALISLGSSSSAEQITKARDWLLFSQGANGCWQNSVRDTAIVLWALEGRAGKNSGGSGVNYCSAAGYFCIPKTDCVPSSNDVGNNFFCASLSDTCCMAESLKSCTDYGGSECDSGEVCSGNTRKATDTTSCCTGTCIERSDTTPCEDYFYTCKDSCSDNQESADYDCDGVQVCCKTKSVTTKGGGSTWWIWVLIILILAVLGAIGWVKREELKLFWFKMRSKFKKDKGKDSSSPASFQGPRPGMPPRPGFPPVRRMPQRIMSQGRGAPPQGRRYDRRDARMSDTFKKLQDMSR
ncbi:MAG: hypothetical protein KKF50_03575 [Nanoarchaeota archaeon]|nr:hypothetical protein [Nanoarchaeota archaeon]